MAKKDQHGLPMGKDTVPSGDAKNSRNPHHLSTIVLDHLFQQSYWGTIEALKWVQAHPEWQDTFHAIETRKDQLRLGPFDFTHMDQLVEPIHGPLSIKADDRRPWLAMCMAVQEHYGLTDQELQEVLARVTYRQRDWYDNDEDYWVD